MAEHSTIEWTDATWNPITGCSVVSPGCTNCYAMQLAGTRLKNHPSRSGLTKAVNGNHVWTGDVRLNEQWLEQPLQWKRPRRIFVCAHGDLFHESVQDNWIEWVFLTMMNAPQHQFQVLTKRSARMRKFCSWIVDPPLPNVWLGVSAEDQQRADERIPDLLATPAAVRFVSLEPLLGPITLWDIDEDGGAPHGCGISQDGALDWVIVGGESGPKARLMQIEWVRDLRDQCHNAGVPYFFKQWGEFTDMGHKVGKKAAGRHLDGIEHNGMPA